MLFHPFGGYQFSGKSFSFAPFRVMESLSLAFRPTLQRGLLFRFLGLNAAHEPCEGGCPEWPQEEGLSGMLPVQGRSGFHPAPRRRAHALSYWDR